MINHLGSEIFLLILCLIFRFLWWAIKWAIKHDLGLLEKPPEASNKAPICPLPSSPPTVWDRELDGPPLE